MPYFHKNQSSHPVTVSEVSGDDYKSRQTRYSNMANRTPETLGDFVRRIRREKNLSCEDVSKQSARFGERISASYINRLENDPRRRATSDRLTALANGLGVPVEELLAHAVGKIPANDADELSLLARFRELSPERKADILRIIELWYVGD